MAPHASPVTSGSALRRGNLAGKSLGSCPGPTKAPSKDHPKSRGREWSPSMLAAKVTTAVTPVSPTATAARAERAVPAADGGDDASAHRRPKVTVAGPRPSRDR